MSGTLHVLPGSAASGLAETLAWLWRLGPLEPRPHPGAVAIGTAADAAELGARVRSRELAGAVVLEGEPPSPPRVAAVSGVGRIAGTGGGWRLQDGVLAVEAAPAVWGHLAAAWVLHAIAGYLDERAPGARRVLEPVGCLRLDDAPATAELQLQHRAKDDATARAQLDALHETLRAAGATLVTAVAAQALRDGEPVPIDELWPGSIARLREGVEGGTFEPACHGLLHLDEELWRRDGTIEPREFARADAAEAGRRLDLATTWMERALGPPRSFIAPAWGYSDGTLAAARARGLLTWLPPAAGPLVTPARGLRETLAVGVPGLHRLDYRPLQRLAGLGVPPTVVFHGRMLDNRPETLRAERAFPTLARLARRRDVARIAHLPGIRWIGAAELAERLAAHAEGARA